MKIITPYKIEEADLDDSNVPLDDADEWDITDVPYGNGDVVMVTTTDNGASAATFKIYQSTAAANSEDPTLRTTYVDDDEDVFWWIEVSSVNRWKMFDQIVQDQTELAEEIIVDIQPGEIFTGLALFNLDAASVQVTITATPEGVIYDEEFDLTSSDGIDNWWDYFNAPIERDFNLGLFDVPGVSGVTLTVKIKNPDSIAKCGALVLGVVHDIGKSQWGAGLRLQTYSRKVTDVNLRTTIDQRAWTDKQSVRVKVHTSRLSAVRRILTDLLNVPAVYAIDADTAVTIVYGFYSDFDIVVPGPVNSTCSIDIEGLQT